MTIDDVPIVASHLKGIKDVVDNSFVVAQQKVVSLLFFVRCFIGNKIAFESSHLAFVEEWTVWAAPQVEEVVNGIFPLFWRAVVLKCRTYDHAYILE